MKNAYFALFYQMLRFTLWTRDKSMPEWTAVCWTSALMFFNTFTIFCIVEVYSPPSMRFGRVPIPAGVFAMVSIIGFNYLNFLHRKDALAELAKFRETSTRLGGYLTAAYVLFSILLFQQFAVKVHDLNVMKKKRLSSQEQHYYPFGLPLAGAAHPQATYSNYFP